MTRLIEEDVTSTDILAEAYSIFHSGKEIDAIALVEKTIDEGLSIPEARCLLGYFYSHLSEYDKAVENFDESLKLDNTSPFARLGLAWLYMGGHGVHKDQERALALLQNSDRNPGVSIMIGIIRLKSADKANHTALAKFNFLKAYSMGNLVGYRLLSHVFWAEKKFCRAIWIEINAFARILPIYIRNRHDSRIWAPWLDWISDYGRNKRYTE